jgi:adenylate cyclase/guanylate cyclase
MSPRRSRSWIRYHRIAVTLLAGVLAAVAGWTMGGKMRPLDGLVYDASLALTDRRPGTREEPVAVIALDRESLDSPELAAIPRVFLSPQWATIVNALTEAQARAIGFDIIFSYSANRFPGAEKQGQYDWDFLAALTRARDRVVLARSGGGYPALPFVGAVFDPVADAGRPDSQAIAYAELTPDADGTFRRVTQALDAADGKRLTTFAAALLARAQAQMPPEVLLAPRRPLEAIPTYRLIDVLRCIDTSPAAVRQAFSGRVVLIGTNLPEEDRKLTPDRFLSPAVPRRGEVGGCQLGRLGASDRESRTSPGVFVHAAAIESVLTGNLITPLLPAGRATAAGLTAIGGALLGFSLPPVLAVAVAAALVALCLAAAPVLLGFGLWFPAMLPAGAAIAAMVVAYIVRFLVEERRRRRVQHAFRYYLAPAMVDSLVDSEAPLRLGGEEREVTVMFADFTGFTAMSGRLSPAALMDLTNAYLALVVEAVEATGGYIIDYVGDAAMAVWGAPLDDPDHAAHAAKAALDACAKVTGAKAAADARREPGYAVKIGINTGPAVVGNVGAPGRYSYKAVGETVNIGARLESLPDDYGCHIVVGPATAAALGGRFVLNELDWVKVKGKDEPLAIYELVAEKERANPAVLAYPVRYHAALEQYRAGKFAEAEECWRGHVAHPYIAEHSPPLVMAERAAALSADPPADWDGVYVKTTK